MSNNSPAAVLKTIEENLLRATSEAIGMAATLFAKRLKSRIPANRRKTRKYTMFAHRKGAFKANAGVTFPADSRFPTEGTRTHEIVTQIYTAEKQNLIDAIARHLATEINVQTSQQIEIRKG